MIGTLGWFVIGMVAGAVALTAIDIFWNNIAEWLNNTAANAVERVLGYKARKCMEKAVARVSKMRDKLHNITVVYTRQSALDTHIQKVTLESSAPLYEQEQDVIELFERDNTLLKELEYRG